MKGIIQTASILSLFFQGSFGIDLDVNDTRTYFCLISPLMDLITN